MLEAEPPRLTGGTLPCQQPTSEQLIRIANDLQTSTGRKLSTEAVLSQLHAIASKLRRYKITAQGGSVSSVSFEQPEIQPIVERSRSVSYGESQVTEDNEEQLEFIKLYQNQFLECLDQTLAQVIDEYINKLQRKRSSVEQSFITALHLFHCQGLSMNQIAPQINLTKQYEVTRLLKLNELRADIRQRLLVILRDRSCSKSHPQRTSPSPRSAARCFNGGSISLPHCHRPNSIRRSPPSRIDRD